MTAERARLHELLRAALLLQAACLLAQILLTLPDWLDARLHPYVPCGLCLDLRGLAFVLSAISLGPVVVLLLLLSWRWRGQRQWPLVVVVLIDAGAIFLTAAVTVALLRPRTDMIPYLASAPALLLLPALVTLALGVNLVRPMRLRPILAASAAGCILLSALLWFFADRPVHQSIPGELSLPFSRTAVYEGRELGCQDYVQGWVNKHTCMRATLLIYRGSGDPSQDEATIARVLASKEHRVQIEELVKPLPVGVDVAVNRTDSPDVDPSNAGLCVIITDRATPPRPNLNLGGCAMVTDYAEIRSHWPGGDAYAIGIIYYWERQDYLSDRSVTFVNGRLGARAGQPATLRVRTVANTRCTIIVTDPSGQSSLRGLEAKSTSRAGDVEWTWLVDPDTTSGQWPITVACGAASGRTSLFVYGQPAGTQAGVG